MDVAVKILRDDYQHDADFVARFHAEALSASRLDHPNLTRVLDFGQENDGLLYLVMEYLDGTSAREILSRGERLELERVTSIMIQVCSGLTHAHARQIVHRDIKPENLMLVKGLDNDGREIELVKVCDFGIAHRVAVKSGAIEPAGTPDYMSPEQFEGEEPDEQSDVYACGVVLYELLTGEVPISGTVDEIRARQRAMDIDRPSSIVSRLDARVDEIVLKALAQHKYDRYESARDLRSDLRALEERAVVAGSTAPRAPRHDSLPDWLEPGTGYLASMMPSKMPPSMPPPAMRSPSMQPPSTRPGSTHPSSPPLGRSPSMPAPSMAPLRPYDGAAFGPGDPAAAIAPMLRLLQEAKSADKLATLVSTLDPKTRTLLQEGQPAVLWRLRALLDAIAAEPPSSSVGSRAGAVKPLLALFGDPVLLAPVADKALEGVEDKDGLASDLILRAEKAGAYALYAARLRNGGFEARSRFVTLLHQIGPAALPVIRVGLERLETRLHIEGAPGIVQNLLEALPNYYDEATSEIVTRYTQSDSPGLAVTATLALPRVAARRARPVLVSLLTHTDEDVALAAIAGIAAFKSAGVDVLEQIAPLVKESGPARHAVRLAALQLTALATPEAVMHGRALCAFVLSAPAVATPDAEDLVVVAASSLLKIGGDRARVAERRTRGTASLRSRLDVLLNAKA
jgi:serine/threonine-protein kinase